MMYGKFPYMFAKEREKMSKNTGCAFLEYPIITKLFNICFSKKSVSFNSIPTAECFFSIVLHIVAHSVSNRQAVALC